MFTSLLFPCLVQRSHHRPFPFSIPPEGPISVFAPTSTGPPLSTVCRSPNNFWDFNAFCNRLPPRPCHRPMLSWLRLSAGLCLRSCLPQAVAFHGQPFTKVVAAELNAERRSREYVVFNIRCHDDAFEWTVLRRFRNFEQLHKRLRNAHGFGGSLPPKRYFGSSNSWEFVEERREQLDEYLRKVTKESVGPPPRPSLPAPLHGLGGELPCAALTK